MYTVDEIMKMLDTKSQEEVVKEFTTALNAATKRKAEENAKAMKAAEKVKAADEVMVVLMKFLNKYYPEWGKETTLTGKDLVEILDNTKFFTQEFKMPVFNPLSDFLKKHNL